MKKLKFLFFLLLLISFTTLSRGELVIEKIAKENVIISELKNPAVFDFIVDNKGLKEDVRIYSLISVTIEPLDKFLLNEGKNNFEVKAYPGVKLRAKPGFLNFEYQIKGSISGITKDSLLIKIVPLNDVLTIEPSPLHPMNSEAEIVIRNMENINLENLTLTFDSPFYSGEEKFSLKPFEKKPIMVKVNKETEKLTAGDYIVMAKVKIEDKEADVGGIIKYLESEGTSYDVESKGTIIKTTVLRKKNYGNTPVDVKLNINKDIISRLFTSYSIDPVSKERKGLSVNYVWEKNLSPSESFEVKVTTNYTIPFILILLIIAVGIFAKIYSQTAVTLNKRVSFVNTKGGHFALKVNLTVKARKHVDNVQIIDRLPDMTKLYEKFGKAPDKIDNATKRIFWNLDRINKGEERVYTYIIYSDLKVVGKFELPAATAVFEKDGKTMEAWSNKTYFASESLGR